MNAVADVLAVIVRDFSGGPFCSRWSWRSPCANVDTAKLQAHTRALKTRPHFLHRIEINPFVIRVFNDYTTRERGNPPPKPGP